ncbi:FG-GAP repeat protein [Streptomyces sp. NPDC049813]|uniref:FG-GAP repeat protein n=1 Tax=Streptomyces sp. NPDC049813 TaxID=3365597 RepID=UPI00379313CA
MDQPRRTSAPARLRLITATAAALTLTGGLFLAATGPASAAAPQVAAGDADFNGDGYADVAASVAFATVSGQQAAGQISVVYGNTAKHTTISQNSAGVPGSAEKADNFGGDLAYGDFDADGFDDLAVGASGEDVGSDVDGGMVTILWGSANGLSGGTTVTDPRPTKHDLFGFALQAGDFDGDGKDDLAVGTKFSATVDVIRGGISRSGATHGTYAVTAPIHTGDAGVRNLHSGDINGDGKDDLLVNGFEKDTEDGWDANFYLPGSASGVTAAGYKKLPAGIITDVGDVNNDGRGDIVFGLSWDDSIPHAQLGGAVLIAKGTASGPAASVQTIDQDTAGVPGAGEKEDGFGDEIDLGDVNGDGHLDLVVGAPGEDVDGATDAGSITVLYGAADGSGITGTGSQFFSQNSPRVPNNSEKNDYFGSDVHVDDLETDGRGDIVVGAMGENADDGAVYTLHSNADGTFSGRSEYYVATLGISASGTPGLGMNFAD